MKLVLMCFVGMLLCVIPAMAAAGDILIADFEGDTYGGWQITGQAFGSGPARGTLPNQMQVAGFKGKGLVNSFYRGDDSTGTLTSPAFKAMRRKERSHPVEIIGKQLRKLMSWINAKEV